MEKYEKQIASLGKKIEELNDQVEKLKRFVASKGLGEAFMEYLKSLAPKTMKQRLEKAKEDAAEHNQKRKSSRQEIERKNEPWRQEI